MDIERKNSSIIRDILVKVVLIVLFVFLLTFIFPMPNLNTFYDAVFNNNVQTMKDAAEDYFTTERMPKEVGEETGLDITDLELCGVKNWYNEEKNERSIVFLYQTKNFVGNLISETEEGKNYWISEEKLLKKELADNFDIMLKAFTKNNFSEMIYNNKTKDWNLF